VLAVFPGGTAITVPFLYDEATEKVRQENLRLVSGKVGY